MKTLALLAIVASALTSSPTCAELTSLFRRLDEERQIHRSRGELVQVAQISARMAVIRIQRDATCP